MANERLKELEELAATLTGVVVNEADPRNWPGGLTPVQELSREEQSARVTCKKSAALSVGLLQKVTDLLNATANPTSPTAIAAAKTADEDEEAALIARLNAESEKLRREMEGICDAVEREYPRH